MLFNQTKYLLGAPTPEYFPPDTNAEVAFVGRSNAGKSSVINALCQRKHLAFSGKTPGVTRMIHFFETQPQCYLVDLPGYGFAAVSKAEQKRWRMLTEYYLQQRESLRGLILAADIRRLLTDADKCLINWCPEHPLLILLTKRDKLNKSRVARARDIVRAEAPEGTVVLPFSKNIAGDAEMVRDMIAKWWLTASSHDDAPETTLPDK